MNPMRFECDSCHAKYKISDDKVRGRLVRFPCRKCDHKILVDGRQVDVDVTVPAGAAYGLHEVTRKSEPASTFEHEAPTARAQRPSASVRRRPPSVPPRRPAPAARKVAPASVRRNATGEGQHPGLAPPVPASPVKAHTEVPEWHVSIHDVPIGPIRLEEMAHKIDSGAVSEYSLVWRAGFDDWRPLATVPELMGLLHERRVSGLPLRTSFSSMPPFVDSHSSSMEHSQPPAPIGPEEIFDSSPSLGAFSGLPPTPDESVSVPSVPPEPAAATAEPQEGISLGMLVLIVSLLVFVAVAGFLAFERYGDRFMTQWLGAVGPAETAAPAQQAQTEAATTQPGDSLPDTVANEDARADALADDIEPDDAEPDGLVVPPPNPANDGPTIAPARNSPTVVRHRARPEPASAVAEDGSLSDEEEKMLREFGSSAHTTPAQISVRDAQKTKSDEPPLDGAGVRATVTANKARLQRCYERAIRGQQTPPPVRLDVTVMVASSGRVKDVNAEGSAPGGLAECVAASVRRWRFPASSEGGPAKFPIVFSAN